MTHKNKKKVNKFRDALGMLDPYSMNPDPQYWIQKL